MRLGVRATTFAELLFPPIIRHELLRFAHLATGNLSHTAAPPERSWKVRNRPRADTQAQRLNVRSVPDADTDAEEA